MKRGAPPPDLRRTRTQARLVFLLLGLGLLLFIAGPLYAWYAVYFSGELALRQKINADDALNGFSFGPVYLRENVTGRYFISTVLPNVEGGSWDTSFEVLDNQNRAVYRQDEKRFIGEFMFKAGERDFYHKTFALNRETGYYWFRFTAHNGGYEANQQSPPVVEFTIRQGVIHGPWLWGPLAAMLLSGFLLLFAGGMRIRRLGIKKEDDPGPGDGGPPVKNRYKPRVRTTRD